MYVKIALTSFAGAYKRLAITTLLLVAISPLTMNSSSANQAETILYVDSELVDCTGVMAQKCMLTRREGETDWSYFYGDIEGFEYEAGYSYKLLVHITTIENPAQDAASLRHKLIKILKKDCEAR